MSKAFYKPLAQHDLTGTSPSDPTSGDVRDVIAPMPVQLVKHVNVSDKVKKRRSDLSVSVQNICKSLTRASLNSNTATKWLTDNGWSIIKPVQYRVVGDDTTTGL